MGRKDRAWLAAGAFFVGAGMASGGSAPRVELAALGLGLALASSIRASRIAIFFFVGALVVWSRSEALDDCLAELNRARPVRIRLKTAGFWQESEAGWLVRSRSLFVRQGTSHQTCRSVVWLTIPGSSSPPRSSKFAVKGYLVRSSPLKNDVRSRAGPWRMYAKSRRLIRPEEAKPRIGLGFRDAIEVALDRVGSSPGARVARALVLGDRRALGQRADRNLRRLGMTHLFAVSGLHVGIVGLVSFWLFRWLPYRVRLLVTLTAIGGYLFLIGARPSILRASFMAFLALASITMERPPSGRRGLMVVGMLLGVLDPAMLSDLGFQLTIAATAGIVFLAPHFESAWSGIDRGSQSLLTRGLAATLGAQLAALPWTASEFSTIHPAAPLLNLVALPWITLAGLVSIVVTMLSVVVPELARLVMPLADVVAAPLGWVDSLPASRFLTVPVNLGFWPAAAVASALVVCLSSRRFVLVSGPLIAVLVTLWLSVAPRLGHVPAEIVAIDVGQGDSLLLRDANHAVLVDGGGWRRGDIAAKVLVPTLARLRVRKLDAVVVSHGDVDHCNGLRDLVYYLPVREVWSAATPEGSPCLRELVARPGVRWRRLTAGSTPLTAGRFQLEVLAPAVGGPKRGRRRANDASLVLRVRLSDRSVLLTGDLEEAGERDLLRRVPAESLASDILKVAHHGSKTSTSRVFLETVDPKLGLISAGFRNRYGHPAEEVLERLHDRGVRVLRTDRDGLIRIALEPATGKPGQRKKRLLP